jgi:hypothetical protein
MMTSTVADVSMSATVLPLSSSSPAHPHFQRIFGSKCVCGNDDGDGDDESIAHGPITSSFRMP